MFKINQVGLNGNLGPLNFESPLTVFEGLGMTRIWSSGDIMCSSIINFCVIDCVFVLFVQIVVNSFVVF